MADTKAWLVGSGQRGRLVLTSHTWEAAAPLEDEPTALALAAVWESQHFLEAVVGALGSVHLVHPDGHSLGRPYVTSYQIAVKVDHTNPTIRGGTRVDVRNRLAIPNPFVSQGVLRTPSWCSAALMRCHLPRRSDR